MDKVKQWVAIAVVVSLGVLAAGWFLLVQPKHAEASELRAQAEQQVTANAALRTHLAVLKAQARDLPKQQAQLAEVQEKIPDNPALPALIRALDTASTTSGVEFVSLVPGTPTPAGALSLVPVTISVVGGFYEVEQYVSLLEDLPRALRISNISVAPGANPVADAASGTSSTAGSAATDGSSLVTVLSGSVFMSPDDAAAATAPAAAGAGTLPDPAGADASAPAS